MKKYFLFLFFLVILILPFNVFAQSSGNVNVSTIVDSKISKNLSTVTLSTRETLADPESHSILITVKLVDSTNAPLPNINVVLSSSRGSVDIIEAVNKIGTNVTADEMKKDQTDAQGLVSFRISSFLSGKTIINILADQLITFDAAELQFDPLPFPANITISVPIPGTKKEITLYSPKQEEQKLSNIQVQSMKLVNTGTKINVSFWYFILIILLMTSIPFFVILSFINVRKIRKMERQALVELQKIEQQNNMKIL